MNTTITRAVTAALALLASPAIVPALADATRGVSDPIHGAATGTPLAPEPNGIIGTGMAQADGGAATGKTTGDGMTPTPATGVSATLGDIAVEAAWTRQSPPGARAGGGYARITNNGTEADVLIGGSAPFAERFEVHEMSVVDGVMRMSELEGGLPIGPGETVTLEPGGFHLMFIGLTEPPVEGVAVPVTLRFERAGEVTLDLPVAAIGAASPGGMDHGTMNHGTMNHGAAAEGGASPSTPDGPATN